MNVFGVNDSSRIKLYVALAYWLGLETAVLEPLPGI